MIGFIFKNKGSSNVSKDLKLAEDLLKACRSLDGSDSGFKSIINLSSDLKKLKHRKWNYLLRNVNIESVPEDVQAIVSLEMVSEKLAEDIVYISSRCMHKRDDYNLNFRNTDTGKTAGANKVFEKHFNRAEKLENAYQNDKKRFEKALENYKNYNSLKDSLEAYEVLKHVHKVMEHSQKEISIDASESKRNEFTASAD